MLPVLLNCTFLHTQSNFKSMLNHKPTRNKHGNKEMKFHKISLVFVFHFCFGKNLFETFQDLSNPSVECNYKNRVESECKSDTETITETDSNNENQILHLSECGHQSSRSDFKIKVRKMQKDKYFKQLLDNPSHTSFIFW